MGCRVCYQPSTCIPLAKKMPFNGQSLEGAFFSYAGKAGSGVSSCATTEVSLPGWCIACLFSVRVQDLPHLFIAPRTIFGERTHTLYCTEVPRGGPNVSTGLICKSAWPDFKTVQQCKMLPSCCCYTHHLLHPHSISKVSPCHTEKIKTIIFTLF